MLLFKNPRNLSTAAALCLSGLLSPAGMADTIGGGTIASPAAGPPQSYGIGGTGFVLVKNWKFGTSGSSTNYNGRFWHSNSVGGHDAVDYTSWSAGMASRGITSYDATQWHVWTWLYRKDNTYSAYVDGVEVQNGTVNWTLSCLPEGTPIDMDFLFDATWGHVKVPGVNKSLASSALAGTYYEWDYSRVYLRNAPGTAMVFDAAGLAVSGSMRVLLAAVTAQVIMGPVWITFAFMRPEFSLHTAMGIHIVFAMVGLPIGTLYAAAELPTLMGIFPRERYGQFCSANAMVRSLVLIVGGVACGAFLDLVKRLHSTPEYCYRFLPVWNLFFQFCSASFLFLLYREWKRLGGMHGFVHPQSDKPDAPAAIPAGDIV